MPVKKEKKIDFLSSILDLLAGSIPKFVPTYDNDKAFVLDLLDEGVVFTIYMGEVEINNETYPDYVHLKINTKGMGFKEIKQVRLKKYQLKLKQLFDKLSEKHDNGIEMNFIRRIATFLRLV